MRTQVSASLKRRHYGILNDHVINPAEFDLSPNFIFKVLTSCNRASVLVNKSCLDCFVVILSCSLEGKFNEQFNGVKLELALEF